MPTALPHAGEMAKSAVPSAWTSQPKPASRHVRPMGPCQVRVAVDQPSPVDLAWTAANLVLPPIFGGAPDGPDWDEYASWFAWAGRARGFPPRDRRFRRGPRPERSRGLT